MPAAVGHYVKGQKLAFPYGTRLVAGPFETSGEAFAEMVRLRPLYPDANLTLETQRKRRLPQVSPRAGDPLGFDLSLPDGRKAAARAVAEHCRLLGFDATLEEWEGEPDVDIVTPAVRASMTFDRAALPAVRWSAHMGAGLTFRDTNSARRIDQVQSWPDLLDALTRGLVGSLDGSVFE